MFTLYTALYAALAVAPSLVSASSVLFPRLPQVPPSTFSTSSVSAAANVTLQSDLCPGLSGTPQCCQLSVLGLAVLTCDDPAGSPDSVAEFKETCAETGRTAECCLLPLLGLGIVCQQPQ